MTHTQNLATAVTPAHDVVAVMKGAGRQFGGTWALRDIDITIHAGQVHAFVGENGAGKSTGLGLLAGRHTPSEGEVTVLGEDVRKLDPRRLRALGVSSVYQELNIFPMLSAAQNLIIGREPAGRFGWLSRRSTNEVYRKRAAEQSVTIPPRAVAGDLSIASRQMLELMRGLDGQTKLLLLDEPTAALPPAERERLFELVREQRQLGVAVVYVSHNLNEVLDLSDVVSVFRNGRHIETKPAAEWTEPSLVSAMVGRDVDVARRERKLDPDAPVVLKLDGLSTKDKLNDVSLQLKRGEILGIAGLAGAGRTTIMRALAGDLRGAQGTLTIDGKALPIPKSPVEALRRGIALLPEDRRRDGLFLPHTSWRNIVMGKTNAGTRGGLVFPKRLQRIARKASERAAFATNRLRSPAEDLSGGNQQKLLVARMINREPKVLLADEPTRGVDIGARADIWRAIQEQAEDGMAVIVVSSEIEELLLSCDRVLVISKGRIVDTVATADPDISIEKVLQRAFEVGDSLES